MDAEQQGNFKVGITAKLLIVLFVIIALIVGTHTWIILDDFRQWSQQDTEGDLLAIYKNYNSEVEIFEQAAASLSASFADRQDIKDLLRAGDREGLLRLLTPVYEQLHKEHNIVHLYVHQPDGTVFVRVHNPDRFGDDILYRRTAARALETRTTIAGVEIGPSRLGIRSVSPLFDQGEYIGAVEVGLDYDQPFIDALKAMHDVDYRMWVSAEAAAPAGLMPEPDAPESPLAGVFYYASTDTMPASFQPEAYQRVLDRGEPELAFLAEQDQSWAVLTAPMYGYGDRIIGVIEISQPQSQIVAALRQTQLTTLGTAALLTLLGLLSMGAVISVFVLRPVKNLTAAARRQLGGDLKARTDNLPNDEFGELGHTLNALTEALDDTVENQEQIIINRTNQLQLTLDIARRLSSILDFNQLLQEAVNLVQDRFNLYHTHIYLLDEDREMLLMAAGYGQAGRQMKESGHGIPLSALKSLVARAARRGEVVRVDEVQANRDWLPNPLLPETRSEMAVPIKLGEEVVGVLDVQSNKSAGFDEEISATLAVVADHVAVAVRNARRFQETAQALEDAQRIQKQYLQAGWNSRLLQQRQTTYQQQIQPDAAPVDPALLAQVRQKVLQGETVTMTAAGNGHAGDRAPESVLAVPLVVRGQVIGHVRVHDSKEGHPWNTEEIALLEAIGDQMSLALENARLFEETERRAGREKMIAETTQQIWASNKLEQVMQTAIRQLGAKLDVSKVVIRLGTAEGSTDQPEQD